MSAQPGLPNGAAGDLVGQIRKKTTQQGVSQWPSHHQPPNAAAPIINSGERGGAAMTASMSVVASKIRDDNRGVSVCFGPGPDSPEALIERFNEYLMRAVVHGLGGTHCGSWFDEETQFALSEVAAAFPDPDPALIAEARASFGRQLDGTHAAERQAEWDAWASAYGSTWPQTPFAQSVTAAFKHVLRFIEHPAEYEEADAVRAELTGPR